MAVRDVQDVKVAFGVRDPWIVLGHSWGAYLALLSALEDPESVRALIYVSGTGTPGWWSDTGSAIYRAERARRMSPGSQRRLEQLDGIERSWEEEVEFRRLSWITDFVDQDDPPEALDTMASTPLMINWDVNRSLSRSQLYSDADLLTACDRCQVPSLFIHGSEDPRPQAGAQLVSERLPNARFVLVDGAGHLPWTERRHETVQAVEMFLDDVLAS